MKNSCLCLGLKRKDQREFTFTHTCAYKRKFIIFRRIWTLSSAKLTHLTSCLSLITFLSHIDSHLIHGFQDTIINFSDSNFRSFKKPNTWVFQLSKRHHSNAKKLLPYSVTVETSRTNLRGSDGKGIFFPEMLSKIIVFVPWSFGPRMPGKGQESWKGKPDGKMGRRPLPPMGPGAALATAPPDAPSLIWKPLAPAFQGLCNQDYQGQGRLGLLMNFTDLEALFLHHVCVRVCVGSRDSRADALLTPRIFATHHFSNCQLVFGSTCNTQLHTSGGSIGLK